MDSQAAIVVAVILPCVVPPSPVRVAVTVIEYSVPSSRLVSVYIVPLPSMPGVVPESSKQSVLMLENEMVKAVAVTPSTSVHEMVRELVDDEADAAESPSGEERNISFHIL